MKRGRGIIFYWVKDELTCRNRASSLLHTGQKTTAHRCIHSFFLSIKDLQGDTPKYILVVFLFIQLAHILTQTNTCTANLVGILIWPCHRQFQLVCVLTFRLQVSLNLPVSCSFLYYFLCTDMRATKLMFCLFVCLFLLLQLLEICFTEANKSL